MMVAVYKSDDEVLIFPVAKNGEHVGKEEFFSPENNRDEDDYAVCVGELPLGIEVGLLVRPAFANELVSR